MTFAAKSFRSGDKGANFMEVVVGQTTKLHLQDDNYMPFVQGLMEKVSQTSRYGLLFP